MWLIMLEMVICNCTDRIDAVLATGAAMEREANAIARVAKTSMIGKE